VLVPRKFVEFQNAGIPAGFLQIRDDLSSRNQKAIGENRGGGSGKCNDKWPGIHDALKQRASSGYATAWFNMRGAQACSPDPDELVGL
jgi:hypothetical protein